MGDLNRLKELVFEQDNKACFIERERIFAQMENEAEYFEGNNRYACRLAFILSHVSTPVLECDYFGGRAIEARPDKGMNEWNKMLFSSGHWSPDYKKVLRLGLCGILKEIKQTAKLKGDEISLEFAQNAEIVVEAVRSFAVRYAKEAEKMGKKRMAEALRTVPYEPAYDFYSALQSVWLLHFILSCYVGARDYAFGRFDEYMLPYYEKSKANGETDEELTELLSGFFIKTNEICGRTTHNFEQKPVPCHSSKQYVNIGGELPNELSFAVLEAAERCNMAQPQIVVLLKPNANERFTDRTFEALSVLNDKMNIYNYDLVLSALLKKGIPENIAKDFGYSACCTFELCSHNFRIEEYIPVPQIFLSVLHQTDYQSLEDLISAFYSEIKCAVQEKIDSFIPDACRWIGVERGRREFTLDNLLAADTTKECRYFCDGDAPIQVINVFCPGIATIGDSLMVLDKLVFGEKRFIYRDFINILDNNYSGYEELIAEIKQYKMFGNDTENDRYTILAGNTFLDAVDSVKVKENYYLMGGFYSLHHENTRGTKMPATPDGRKSGEPYSENQSPTYGADKSGITALLNSIAKLPLERTVTGGLNVMLSRKASPEILKALVTAFFKNGGLHIGLTVADKEVLKDAMKHPLKYPTLTVRLYGFSEYFISLPDWQQEALINRTDYNV